VYRRTGTIGESTAWPVLDDFGMVLLEEVAPVPAPPEVEMSPWMPIGAKALPRVTITGAPGPAYTTEEVPCCVEPVPDDPVVRGWLPLGTDDKLERNEEERTGTSNEVTASPARSRARDEGLAFVADVARRGRDR
jgi:hypothetical protein